MGRRRAWRTFIAAFILTLCVLALGCAFLLIEYNVQRTTYGTVDFGVSYTMQEGVPRVRIGEDEPLAVPPRIARVCEAAVPPPIRLLVALWRGETEAVEEMLKELK
ncbi:MAG: hypothetical protein IJB26_00145 [Clostridia bacterium]|nr:hypothetical protein [Clostridia bacterium]